MQGNDVEAFQRFVKVKRAKLKSIAARTGYEYSLEDVEAEAWLMAFTVAENTGLPINFDDHRFQDRLLAFLCNELTKYSEVVVRHAVRLDRQIDGKDVAIDDHPVMRRQVGLGGGDPLEQLISKEDERERIETKEPGPHESRAGAYLLLLRRFDNKMRAVADHLLISRSYCYFRLSEARLLAARQLPLGSEGLVTSSAEDPRAWRPFRHRRAWVQIELDFGSSRTLWGDVEYLSGSAWSIGSESAR